MEFLELAKSKAPRTLIHSALEKSLADRTRYEEAAVTLRSALRVSEPKEIYIALAEKLARADDLPAARRTCEGPCPKLAEEVLLA
jgi:hypothetical protein